MIIIPLIYQFMDAKTLYRIIFVGNEPYKNRRKIINNRMKRQVHQLGTELQEDDYSNILMVNDLSNSVGYVRKSISRVFKILIFKILESKLEFKTSEVEIFRNRNSEYP